MSVDRRLFLRLLAAVSDQALDVQLLQTAASIENLLVATYDTLLGSPLLTGPTANQVFRNLVTTSRLHHGQHADACNEIAASLGGKRQTSPNSGLGQVAARVRTGADLATAIDVALQLETAAAQTYQNAIGLLTDVNARRLAGSILGVEGQHVGVLNLARELNVRTPELLVQEAGMLFRLPAEAGTAGFPDPFGKVDQARPASEGAVR